MENVCPGSIRVKEEILKATVIQQFQEKAVFSPWPFECSCT